MSSEAMTTAYALYLVASVLVMKFTSHPALDLTDLVSRGCSSVRTSQQRRLVLAEDNNPTADSFT